MKRDEVLFNEAVKAMQDAELDSMQAAASGRRVASRLGLDVTEAVPFHSIESCFDVRRQQQAYQAGSLTSAQSMLIESHLGECSPCRRVFRGAPAGSEIDWRAPRAARTFAVRPQTLAWSFASAAAIFACSLFVYRAYWQVPPGVRAAVRSVDGSAYAVSSNGDRLLNPGDSLSEGERMRTAGGARAVLQLSDGSTVEVNERSVLQVGARGRNTTLTLDDGAVIVEAAKRDAGHLYVKTPDCRLAVTGTVFTVNSGIKGSQVAVLEGAVNVNHAGVETMVRAGNQLTTNDNLSPAPMERQIAWSRNREKFLPVLAQLHVLEQRIEQIPFPQPRYTSDLFDKVPADTLLFVSIPNLGDFLSEADKIFDDQLSQSPALQQWWSQGHDQNTAELDAIVGKIHSLSQYLGDEIVVTGAKTTMHEGFAILADVKSPGLEDYLKGDFQSSVGTSSNHGANLTVFDQATLDAASGAASSKHGAYALVLPDHVVFSNNIATLKLMEGQLKSGSSGFANSDFGKQIAAAYTRGAGMILAADINQMMSANAARAPKDAGRDRVLAQSGIEDARYLIAEHRELNGLPQNHVSLQFAGTRKGVASWLSGPAPLGSLDFITPNASIVAAGLTKDPALIADDILSMASANNANGARDLANVQQMLQISIRNDLAANLGGEFLVALDGPVLPTPSWKAVIEVRDAQKFEQTLEKLTVAAEIAMQQHQTSTHQGHQIKIMTSEAAGHQFYAINDLTAGKTLAEYTFANGYMIAAQSRAIVMEALKTYASGDSLGRSATFRTLLPKDSDANYSAIAYQNVSPVIGPLASQFSGQSAALLQKMAVDARPTVICARGEESRIEASSDSHLFGFDFFTLGQFLNMGNKNAASRVSN